MLKIRNKFKGVDPNLTKGYVKAKVVGLIRGDFFRKSHGGEYIISTPVVFSSENHRSPDHALIIA